MYAAHAETAPKLITGENYGTADSVAGCGHAYSETHWCLSRRPLRIPQRQTFASLLSDAISFSLLRHGTRSGSGFESEVSRGEGHLEPANKGFGHKSQLRRHTRRFRGSIGQSRRKVSACFASM
jgi:hypothetical protein